MGKLDPKSLFGVEVNVGHHSMEKTKRIDSMEL